MIKKIVRALISLPWSFRKIRNPRVIMTLLVKNEEDLLERNLQFHKAMGVDGFIITDNNSTDTTPEIIRKYREKGWVLEAIRETSSGYEQKRWVDRMVCLAITRHGADWIINADADEFWYAPSGSFKTELSGVRPNVLTCSVINMYPDEDAPFTQWTQAVKAVPVPEEFGLSPFSIFGRGTVKVLHRAAGYLQISMGNHKVAMLPRWKSASDIRIYHYNFRGREQFLRKMINGGKEMETHKSNHGARHWKYFYQLYKDGKLNEEYDRTIGTASYDELRRRGYIYDDPTIAGFFAKNGLK